MTRAVRRRHRSGTVGRRWLAALAAAGIAGSAMAMDVAERDRINPGLGSPPPQVQRNTPAATWSSFLTLGRSGDFAFAAHLLDLTEVTPEKQRDVGTEVARKLYRVLRAVGARADAVTDDTPVGPEEGGAPTNSVVAARFDRNGIGGEVWLRRTKDLSTGEEAWLFTRRTVSEVATWYEVVVEGRRPKAEGPLNPGLGALPVGVDRQNPRVAYEGFMAAARTGDFDRAAHYLDLGAFPPSEQPDVGRHVARRLMLVLTRNGWVDPGKVSNDPGGDPEGPADTDVLAEVKAKGKTVPISMTRRFNDELGYVWTFSQETVADVDLLYGAHGYWWIGDHLPAFFFAVSFGGLQLWQWAALLGIVIVGYFVGRVAGSVIVRVFARVAGRTRVEWDDAAVKALDGPLGVVLWGAILAVASPWVGLSAAAQKTSGTLFDLLILAGVGWLLFRAVDATAGHLRGLAGPGNFVAESFIPILSRVGKILIVIFVVLISLDTIGLPVATALAGLGIGGLAIAFAAQKTIENLFGAFAIAGDRPFKVGDFVIIGDVMGSVEDVGLRSTRVRTLQRTVVTIPNSTVSTDKVTNFAVRDRMLFNPVIGVVYGTTMEQIRFVVDETRKMLLTHPRVWQEAHRVRFKQFGAYSLDIEVFCWIESTDYNEYTGIAEELNFLIADIVERAGTSFAFPSQTLYMTREAGIDPGQAKEVGAEVERRRERGELAIPEPSEALRARLQSEREGS